MVVAEAYLPIIFAAVFEVWSETVMSINSWQPLALNGQSGAKAGIWWSIVVSTLPVVSPLTTGGKFRRVERRL